MELGAYQMNRLVKWAPTAIAALMLSASGAFAMDWTLKTHFDETVEVGNNYFLSTPPSGMMYVPTTTLGADFIGRTPTMKFELNTLESYRIYEGPAASGLENTLSTYNHGDLAKATDDGLTIFNVGASYRTQEIAQVQLVERGVGSGGQGTVNTALVEGGMKHEIDATNTLNWLARATSTTFTNSTSTPFTDVHGESTWTHLVNRTTDLTNLMQIDWLSYDNVGQTQLLLAKGTEGIKKDLSSQLIFTGAIGAAFLDAKSTGSGGGPTVFSPFLGTTQQQSGNGSSFDWIGNANLTYKLTSTTQFQLFASKAVGPTTVGQILSSDTFGTSISHDINSRSQLVLFSTFMMQTGSTTVDIFSASAAYTYHFTPEWQGSLTYTFRELVIPGVTANVISFRLARDFTIGAPVPDLGYQSPYRR
jgi:hypothetical protein